MSCETEKRKRETFNVQFELAKKCKSLYNEDIIIYEFEPGRFGFCGKSEYSARKGVKRVVLSVGL
jgi:hypothetical protein